MALDGAPGDKQLYSSVNVDIKIIDINNKPPIFHDPEPMTIFENSPVSILCFNIIIPVTAISNSNFTQY